MNGPGPEIGDTTETPVRGGRLPAPEVIGLVAAVIVLVVVGTSVLAGGGGTPSAVGPSPTATTTLPTIEPSATPPVDPSIVTLLGAINQKLVDYAEALQRELDRSKLQTAEVASLIRQVIPTVRLGADAVPKLRGFLGP